MTVFQIRLKMAQGGGSWPNPFKYSYVYYANLANVSEAAAKGAEIWEALKQGHGEYAYCASVYASDLTPVTAIYEEIAIPSGDQRGLVNYGSNVNAYHPEVCYRQDMTVTASRPSRKYFRLAWTEDDLAPGGRTIISSSQDVINGMTVALAAVEDLCDVDGQPLVGFVNKGVTTHDLGRDSFALVPPPPPFA